MKSYNDHLKSIKKSINQNFGIYRSSAIFPVLVNNKIDTEISFLSYWFLKRKIKTIIFNLVLRDKEGNNIFNKKINISFTKVFNFSINKLLASTFYKLRKENFIGSIELEFLSKVNMVFPFPAVMINLKSENSSAFVHTCGRIFNNTSDKRENTKSLVPESGFDLLPNKSLQSFFSFVNGKTILKNVKIKLEMINFYGEKIYKNYFYNKIQPFETNFIFFLNKDEKNFLRKKKGIVKIYHNFKNFYPRFMAGNFDIDYNLSTLTHTYYDLSRLKDKNPNIWKNPDRKKYFDSSVAVPIYLNKRKTELAVYPTYFNKPFYLKILIDLNGKLTTIFSKKIDKINKPLYLNLSDKCQSYKKLIKKKILLGKIICSNTTGIPSRIKFGLNIFSESKLNIPSNVCFNTFLPILNGEKKPGTFRWGFVNPDKNFEILILNNSYLKKGNKDANIKIKFWNDKKDNFVEFFDKVKNQELKVIKPNNKLLMKNFFLRKNYWFTIESDNPFLSGYFVNFNKNGLVGAEHFF